MADPVDELQFKVDDARYEHSVLHLPLAYRFSPSRSEVLSLLSGYHHDGNLVEASPVLLIEDFYASTPSELSTLHQPACVSNDVWYFLSESPFRHTDSSDRVTGEGGSWKRYSVEEVNDGNNHLLGYCITENFYDQEDNKTGWKNEQFCLDDDPEEDNEIPLVISKLSRVTEPVLVPISSDERLISVLRNYVETSQRPAAPIFMVLDTYSFSPDELAMNDELSPMRWIFLSGRKYPPTSNDDRRVVGPEGGQEGFWRKQSVGQIIIRDKVVARKRRMAFFNSPEEPTVWRLEEISLLGKTKKTTSYCICKLFQVHASNAN